MDQSIDFNVAIDLSSDEEDTQTQMADDDEDVDLYGDLQIVLLAHDPLAYEELSDLSGDEFLEEYSTKQPAALEEEATSDLSEDELMGEHAEPVPDSAAPEDDIQELSFLEDDLLFEEPRYSSTRPSSPTNVTATPPTSPASADIDIDMDLLAECPQQNNEPVQGCDPAVMYRTKEEIEKIIAKLPFRPLQATIDRWMLRTASPSMQEYITRIRKQMDAEGPSKFFLPWNLRDTINVKKERQLAQGPYVNRQMLIEEYRLKKIRESWSKLDDQQ